MTKIEVKGLREFTRALGRVDKGFKRQVRLALNEAADLVVDDAKPTVAEDTGKAASTIRSVSTQSNARVRGGGAKAPYYPWLDFGGRVGKYKQVERDYTKEGRYIYPTYRGHRDSGKFQETMTKALVELGDKAGLEVKAG